MTTSVVQSINLSRPARRPMFGPIPQRDIEPLKTKVFPVLRTLIKAGYFSLTVEGAEHVPRSGPAIYVGNHAGWFTLDTILGALAVTDHIGIDRLPWGAVQDELLKTPRIGRFFEGMGGFPASWLKTPEAIPPEMEVFSVYPEGTEGNCKSFLHAYQMRQWRTGFLRIAAARNAPIVPVSIIGGEECLPVATPLNFLKPILGTILPLPLALVPLPSRWKFIFHKPVLVTRDELEANKQRPHEIAAEIRACVQRTLDEETSNHMLVRFSKLVMHPSHARNDAPRIERAAGWT